MYNQFNAYNSIIHIYAASSQYYYITLRSAATHDRNLIMYGIIIYIFFSKRKCYIVHYVQTYYKHNNVIRGYRGRECLYYLHLYEEEYRKIPPS